MTKGILVALLAALHVALYWDAGPVDDDFICARYGASLLEGRGLAWNGTEQSEGFSVPLWVLIHAAGQALGIEATLTARVVGVLAAGVATLVLARAGGVLPALVLALMPAFAFHGAAGLGTLMQAALLALHGGSLLRAAREKRSLSLLEGLPLALACLLRQEAALFVLPLLMRERRAALPALLTLAGWTLFRLLWFGRLLPLTASVKKLPFLTDLSYGLEYLLADLAVLATLPLLLLVLWKGPRRSPLLIGVLLHVLFVVWVGGDHVAWSRYLVPITPLLLLLAFQSRSRFGAQVLAAALILIVQGARLLPAEDPRSHVARFLDHQHFEARWQAIGRWMRDTAPPGTRLATSPIGAIGYESRLPILDLLGLVHEYSLAVPPELSIAVKGHHRPAAAWVLAQEPEWILLGNGARIEGALEICPWERTLYTDPRFGQRYRRVEVPLPAGPPLDLFVRKDLPAPAGASE